MPNGNQRGSSADRRRRRVFLTSVEAGWGGNGVDVPCWLCGVLVGDDLELFVDRILPCHLGGTYRRDNIAPSCEVCSHREGQTLTVALCNARRAAA